MAILRRPLRQIPKFKLNNTNNNNNNNISHRHLEGFDSILMQFFNLTIFLRILKDETSELCFKSKSDKTKVSL